MPKSNNSKCYMMDTSTILDDVDNIFKLSDNGQNSVFISNVVYAEMNNKKKALDDAAWNAREFFRLLNNESMKILDLRNVPACIKESFKKFRKSKSDKVVKYQIEKEGQSVDLYSINRKTWDVDSGKTTVGVVEPNDLRIAEISLDYKMVMVTNDAGLHMHIGLEGGSSEFLFNDTLEKNIDDKFSVALEIEANEEKESLPDFFKLDISKYLNFTQFVITEINHQDKTKYETGRIFYAIKYLGQLEILNLDEDSGLMSNSIIKYKKKEQAFYHSILKHPSSRVITVSGATGSGKTLLAINAGIELVKEGAIDGIVYTRNTITANDDKAELGFRKGDENQKLGYFMMPLFGAINTIIEKMKVTPSLSISSNVDYSGDTNSTKRENATDKFMQDNKIEIVDIAHLRGTTINKKMIIIDESQNMSGGTMKLIGTRLGEGTRIIIAGDLNQIDHPFLSKHRNALTKMMNLAANENFVAGIQLKHTVRSDVAEWFDKNL